MTIPAADVIAALRRIRFTRAECVSIPVNMSKRSTPSSETALSILGTNWAKRLITRALRVPLLLRKEADAGGRPSYEPESSPIIKLVLYFPSTIKGKAFASKSQRASENSL
jgi:hypothetical protein